MVILLQKRELAGGWCSTLLDWSRSELCPGVRYGIPWPCARGKCYDATKQISVWVTQSAYTNIWCCTGAGRGEDDPGGNLKARTCESRTVPRTVPVGCQQCEALGPTPKRQPETDACCTVGGAVGRDNSSNRQNVLTDWGPAMDCNEKCWCGVEWTVTVSGWEIRQPTTRT